MSAEARRVMNRDVWTQWEGRVVNGIFPLRRCLGGSDHGAVFLTEYQARNLADAAIKFVPADALRAQARLAQWQTVGSLSHPHLIRLFDAGRCRLGEREFLFVVMEYAEQTLEQVLARRALSVDEATELLLPTLDALAFLHRRELVHGRLRPSNFLAVDDRLKLASDNVLPAGHADSGIVGTSAYYPPELKERGLSPAGDIWGLGMTLVEALTRRTPGEQREAAALPSHFPAPFAAMVRRCLSPAPADRPTVIELEAHFKPAPQTHSIAEPQPPAREAAAPRSFPQRHLLPLSIAAALLIAVAVWMGVHFSGTSPTHLPLPAVSAPATAQPNAGLPSAARPAPPSTATSSSVLREVSPDIPRAILDKIQGRIVVTARVLVDTSGNVIGVLLENAGPSRYFARRAEDAAREWQFAPANDQPARVWLLRFAFSRDGVTASATAQ